MIGSSLRDAKASGSMVGRLSFGGSGSKLTTGSVNWKLRKIFSLVSPTNGGGVTTEYKATMVRVIKGTLPPVFLHYF